MTIPRNLSFLAEGASSTGVLGTANGGTNLTSFAANGVVYASSTSALATGSALTFNGTTFTNTGNSSFGEVSGTALTLNRVTSGNNIDLNFYNPITTAGVVSKIRTDGDGISNTYGAFSFQTTQTPNSTVERYRITSTGVSIWSVGGTESMRLTSTGLGIGTSSPTQALTLGAGGVFRLYRSDNATYGDIYHGTSGIGLVYNDANGNGHQWQLSGTTALNLDSNGNLGLGVTPSAWASGDTVLQIKAGSGSGALWGRSNSLRVVGNAYYDGTNYKYVASDYASFLNINPGSTGGFVWNIAPSGTAGSTATFTQAMTLDSSGNLGLGVTPNTWSSSWSGKILQLGYGTVAGYSDARLEFFNNCYVNTSSNVIYSTSNGATVYAMGASSGVHAWYNAPSGTAGTTCTLTQAMTLTNSGNLLIGATTTGPVNANAITIEPTNSVIRVAHSSTGNGTPYVQFDYNGSNIGSITQSTTSTVAYNVTSDQRLKTNIVDAPAGNIDQIKIRSFDWKSDGTHNTYGVIAQELLEVAPYAVHQPIDPNEMMGVDYSKLVPMMIKEIQSLKAEVATLKGA